MIDAPTFAALMRLLDGSVILAIAVAIILLLIAAVIVLYGCAPDPDDGDGSACELDRADDKALESIFEASRPASLEPIVRRVRAGG